MAEKRPVGALHALTPKATSSKVAIVVGSRSDLPIVEASELKPLFFEYGLAFEIIVISSDREPEKLRQFCLARGEDYLTLIGVAGGVPNLPLVIKSWLPGKPVICVPIEDRIEYVLASLTSPYDVPVIIAGFGRAGLRKAARIAYELRCLVEGITIER